MLQLAAVSGENRPKYVVFCAKRGEILARYTEPSGLRLLLPRGELFWSNALVEWFGKAGLKAPAGGRTGPGGRGRESLTTKVESADRALVKYWYREGKGAQDVSVRM